MKQMFLCKSNPALVMRYEKKSVVSSYANLSKSTFIRVIDTLRTEPIKTNKVNPKFYEFVKKEGIIVFSDMEKS